MVADVCFVLIFQVMEYELMKLHDTVASIHDEMFYLRERYNFIQGDMWNILLYG